MKKIIVRLLVGLVVLVVVAALAVGLFLDGAVKKAVETYGPKLTKGDVKLQGVSLSVFGGSGSLRGLVVGNPEGFKLPTAISVGNAALALKPGSLLSDKIVITSINLQAPEITYETDLKRDNLSKILANVREATGSGGQAQPANSQQPTPAKPAKKFEVDEFSITGAKVHVSATTPLGAGSAVILLPDIHLKNLGTGPEGITGPELTQVVLAAIRDEAVKAASGAVSDISKGAVYVTKDPGALRTNAVDAVGKGIGGFLKGK